MRKLQQQVVTAILVSAVLVFAGWYVVLTRISTAIDAHPCDATPARCVQTCAPLQVQKYDPAGCWMSIACTCGAAK